MRLLLLPSDLLHLDSYSKVIYDREGNILRIYLNNEEQFVLPPVNEEKIPEKLIESVLQYEDKNYYDHIGVDFKSIVRAIYLNVKQKRVVSGASTIPMQTIGIFRKADRTYLNKLVEIIYAIQLDMRYSKDEILKLYLNHAPYGGNIIGYRSASLKYFNKIPEKLTWAEACTLAILPNAPSLLTAVKNRERFIEKRNRLLEELYEAGKFSREDYELSLLEELPERLYKTPQEALFFTDYVKDKEKSYEVHTTLDSKIQNKVEETIGYYKDRMEKYGVYNEAVMVVGTRNREILGYWGGSYSTEHAGMIDAIHVKRSSASTLKPFLYALAFDEGLITQKSLLEDIPSYFQSFNPVNSDKSYRGLVSAEEALRYSLNVPMVKLLDKLDYHKFHDFFEKNNISKLRDSDFYGLSMILGTIEVSPYELAGLYTDLGNLGERGELKVLKNEKDKIEEGLYSKGAAWLTMDILSRLERPTRNWEFFRGKIDFYWKTGTSYGERDAWAVGTNKDYTIVVWYGNLDNKSSEKLKGITGAAPLLFDLLDKISQEKGSIDMPVGELKKVGVSENGYRSRYGQWGMEYIPKKSVLMLDPYEKLIYTDMTGKVEVDSRTWKEGKYKSLVINEYSNSVRYFMKLRGYEVEKIKRLKEKRKPEFIYPKEGIKIRIPYEEKIGVEVAEVEGAKEYHWYINGSYESTTAKPKVFFAFPKGENRIDMITDKSDSASISFYVE